MAIWLLGNCKNGVSSYELARDLGLTQKPAWFMLHRIRRAMQDDSLVSSVVGSKPTNLYRLTYAEVTGKTKLNCEEAKEEENGSVPAVRFKTAILC